MMTDACARLCVVACRGECHIQALLAQPGDSSWHRTWGKYRVCRESPRAFPIIIYPCQTHWGKKMKSFDLILILMVSVSVARPSRYLTESCIEAEQKQVGVIISFVLFFLGPACSCRWSTFITQVYKWSGQLNQVGLQPILNPQCVILVSSCQK